jgi:hypothetical protein
MYLKIKMLTTNGENCARTQVAEIKIVSLPSATKVIAKRGIKKVPQQNLWVDCGSGRAPRVW